MSVLGISNPYWKCIILVTRVDSGHVMEVAENMTCFLISVSRMERDAQFTQRKAERATLRTHFRDKYRLPKVNLDAFES